MSRESNPYHPADLSADCDCHGRPIGFTAQKKFTSCYPFPDDPTGQKCATGEGYGHSEVSQAEADEMARDRATKSASLLLRLKLGIRAFFSGSLVNESEGFKLIAPLGTSDMTPKWEGRITKKPWEYKVTVAIPHLDTIEPLMMVIETLRAQTERPYIIIIDTGSPAETTAQLDKLRAEDLEIHYLRGHAYRHSSEPVPIALDLAHAMCKTEYLFHTHSDVFLRRVDFIEILCRLVNEKTPVVGYRMSPRDWITKEWEWMVGHTALMLHMPTMHKIGATWSMERMHRQYGYSWDNLGGWPDTETGFNHVLRDAGIQPIFMGFDENYTRFVDQYIDHVRSYPGSKVYAEKYFAGASNWMADAMKDAKDRLKLQSATLN